jgi:cytochrome c oxidase cbb3-type subunit 3
MSQDQTSKTSAANVSEETTGHQWDGIQELNNPLPRWWLWTFYITIIWAVGYMVLYPAVPLLTQATPGVFGYASRADLEKEINHYKQANAALDTALVSHALSDVPADQALTQYAVSGGRAVFQTFCAQCHGAGAGGNKGYPNLLDDDWLWGGSLPDIYLTVRHGIRSQSDEDTRLSEMAAYGEILEPSEIEDVSHYVMSISGGPFELARLESGRQVFNDNCTDCHGATGAGNREFGAPNLRDALWLYGGDRESVVKTITHGRNGVMPAWRERLTEAQLRQVTLYVHQLGGGE